MSTIKKTTVNSITKNKKTPNKEETYPIFEYNDTDRDDIKSKSLDQFDLGASSGEIIIKTGARNNYNVNFNTDSIPYCCGILEIGQLGCTNTIPNNLLAKVLDDIINSNCKGITFMINTNGVGNSRKYEAALVLCENWTKVKTFKSASSKNTITMWVSNNE